MQRKVRNQTRAKRLARKGRVARSIERSTLPRLTVFRSSKHMYAQLDDPLSGRTLATVSTRSKGLGLAATGNIEAAKRVGQAIAEAARAKQIEQVVFNRNGFLYHGRVKAVADAAREAGLRI